MSKKKNEKFLTIKEAAKEIERTKQDYETKRAITDASAKEFKEFDVFGKVDAIKDKKRELSKLRRERLEDIAADLQSGKLDKDVYNSIEEQIYDDYEKNYAKLNKEEKDIMDKFDKLKLQHNRNIASSNAATMSHVEASNNYERAERKYNSDKTKIKVAGGLAVAGGAAYLAHKAYKKHKAKESLRNRGHNRRGRR